ncbi:hypothetical protein BN1708_005062 [Verticillium longisporum]|uniref:Glucose-methanol-choline oxidoreductase N-terminal domain-containing protein n=1 Tax=Verticillium longisporum TaxID=100787 RepID=A0A0G4M6K5_VERLO|nr:hypothetical protein BN1708_005062 [Verticillium longisporum]
MADPTTYDIIIVGGGTAGLVLAARLSEDASLRILVIEAGQDLTSDPRISIPPYTGLGGRELAFTQGRLLGGSSAINGLSFTPTSKSNVDAWAKLGNPGWQWEDFAQSFAKCYTLPAHAGDGSGPIKLSLPNDPGNPWAGIWNQTLSNLGHAGKGDAFTGQVSGAFTNTDANDPNTRQRSYAEQFERNQPGCSGKSHIRHISTRTVVATGVLYNKDGEIHHVRANNEVILAAGAVNSPKILELSGVGDPQRLISLGIESIVENTHVGENLQNHIMCGMSFEVLEGLATMDPLARQDEASVAAAMDAYGKQSGPFASSGTNAVAQLPFPVIETAEGKSDLEQLMSKHKQEPSNLTSTTPAFAEAHEDFVRSILVSQDEASACYLSFPGFAWFKPDGTMASPPSGPENYFSVALLLAHPLSRGSVHIKSSSARTDSTQIAIDPAHLTHPLDIEIMSRHLQFLETIVASKPLVDHLKPGGKRNPGATHPFTDIESARDYIKRTAVGGNHPVGTCSMMPRELGGVVDSNLRVYGCSKLRVCDASIIPILPRANLQATVYGVAEHAAGIIRGTKLNTA